MLMYINVLFSFFFVDINEKRSELMFFSKLIIDDLEVKYIIFRSELQIVFHCNILVVSKLLFCI